MRGLPIFITLFLAAGASAGCEAPLNARQITALCRVHSGDVLVFEWRGARHVLPIDPVMSLEQDAAWRALLGLPQKVDVPGRTFSHSIGAVHRFADGWLVGIDGGEWGGGLFYIQQTRPPQELVRENVVALVPTSQGVHALFGLAHMTLDDGRYRLISHATDGPIVGAAQPLPGSPIYISQDNNGVTFVAGGFGTRGQRTWARVFGGVEPESANVYSPCN